MKELNYGFCKHTMVLCKMDLFSGFKISESDSDRHSGTIRDELFLHHKNSIVNSKFFNVKTCNIISISKETCS